ncbi:MAG: saccharopine dehydrogenase [Candidatus Cloacimonadota bacterium]|nr:MAG: saccharopine dehydrogenase [Candidatus Cloacimonadota bacterium]
MKKIIVLGAGMIGSAIAIDLSSDYEVTVVDKDSHKLNPLKEGHSLRTIIADLSTEIKIQEMIIDYDLVIGSLPGFMGYKTLHSVISEGKDIIDISFLPQDTFKLDELAKENEVTAVVDCGISPGLSNIILGYYNRLMEIEEYRCMVGGLPFKKEWPFYYKAFFSPLDVIEEYTRPARIVKNGEVITVEALSEPEIIELPEVGKLEAFNTDGLRTLITTMKIPNMIEKTLRYPGHIDLMKMLRETGFFGKDEVNIRGDKVKPIELTSKLLFPYWKPDEDEKEFTILNMIIKGNEDGKQKELVYNLFDKFDEETKITSMARTTGYTCTSVARLILNGDFSRKGINPPEYIGAEPECYKKVMAMLKEKSVNIIFEERLI